MLGRIIQISFDPCGRSIRGDEWDSGDREE